MKTPKLAFIPIMAIGLTSLITLSGCSDDPEFNKRLGLAISKAAQDYNTQQEEDRKIRNIVNQELNAYDRQRVFNENMNEIIYNTGRIGKTN
jgi:hypothetical protein